jgi:hypothetical protein
MKVHMKPEEQALFVRLLERASSYTEFGSGGSTVLASSLVSGQIATTDSSQEWLDKVARECADAKEQNRLHLVFADIGPTREWGQPVDDSTSHRWPLYALSVWRVKSAANADLFLVDGRFRVACFLEILLRCRKEAKIAIHDYPERRGYHVVEKFADCIETAGSLHVFTRSASFDVAAAQRRLDQARYEPG